MDWLAGPTKLASLLSSTKTSYLFTAGSLELWLLFEVLQSCSSLELLARNCLGSRLRYCSLLRLLLVG